MTENREPVLTGELLDATDLCTVEEVSIACNVAPHWITELVEHGVIEPIGQGRSDWKFTSLTIVRAAKAKRLERDLGLNLPGVALALDLLDEIEGLRAQLRSAATSRER